MAAGAVTLDTYDKNPQVVGAGWRLTGNIQVDNTYRGFALLPSTSYILSCTLTDTSGAGRIECDLNTDSTGTTTLLGSIGVAGNHVSTNTYNFVCNFANM